MSPVARKKPEMAMQPVSMALATVGSPDQRGAMMSPGVSRKRGKTSSTSASPLRRPRASVPPMMSASVTARGSGRVRGTPGVSSSDTQSGWAFVWRAGSKTLMKTTGAVR